MKLTLLLMFNLIYQSCGFNYMDYANLYNGEVHLHTTKILGHLSWQSMDKQWNAWEYLGIKYATAERFQAPKIFEDFDHAVFRGAGHKPQSLSIPGPACPNAETFNTTEFPLNSTSEDCLFLNVYLPAVNREHSLFRSKPWPVLIHIEGEQRLDRMYGKNAMARELDTVVISLNFRQGMLGFLSMESFEARGNWGLKDIKMAVKWIRQHVSQFGADPLKITLSGEGSGAHLVSLLVLDHEIRETVSGFIYVGAASTLFRQSGASPYNDAMELAHAVGCALRDTEPTLECLREKDLAQILEGGSKTESADMKARWLATVDGDMLAEIPDRLLQYRNWHYNGSFLHIIPYDVPAKDDGHLVDNAVLDQKHMAQILSNKTAALLGCSIPVSLAEKMSEYYLDNMKSAHDSASMSQFEAETTSGFSTFLTAEKHVHHTSHGQLRYQVLEVDSSVCAAGNSTSTAPGLMPFCVFQSSEGQHGFVSAASRLRTLLMVFLHQRRASQFLVPTTEYLTRIVHRTLAGPLFTHEDPTVSRITKAGNLESIKQDHWKFIWKLLQDTAYLCDI